MIIFLMLKNYTLRKILRKIDLKFPKKSSNKENKEKKLYDILIFYEDTIEIDIENEKIIIPKEKLTIPLQNFNLETIEKNLHIKINKEFSESLELDSYKNYIIYYYPKQFYEEKNLLQIFWFYSFFIRDYIILIMSQLILLI